MHQLIIISGKKALRQMEAAFDVFFEHLAYFGVTDGFPERPGSDCLLACWLPYFLKMSYLPHEIKHSQQLRPNPLKVSPWPSDQSQASMMTDFYALGAANEQSEVSFVVLLQQHKVLKCHFFFLKSLLFAKELSIWFSRENRQKSAQCFQHFFGDFHDFPQDQQGISLPHLSTKTKASAQQWLDLSQKAFCWLLVIWSFALRLRDLFGAENIIPFFLKPATAAQHNGQRTNMEQGISQLQRKRAQTQQLLQTGHIPTWKEASPAKQERHSQPKSNECIFMTSWL